MPSTSLKLAWSMSPCTFCPRSTSDVRTCKIKSSELTSKISSALDMNESDLTNSKSKGICTCCLADVDTMLRMTAIKGAMKIYFYEDIKRDTPNQLHTSANAANNFSSNHQKRSYSTSEGVSERSNCSSTNQQNMKMDLQQLLVPTPLPPNLTARPPFPMERESSRYIDISPPTGPNQRITTPTTGRRPPKERLTRYQCLKCNKIAGSKSHCMEHLISHSEVRPFTCAHCMKPFKSRKACREHLVGKHGVEKLEDNLQRLVIVDNEGLKELEHICTLYRKLENPNVAKPVAAEPSPCAATTLKSEPKEQLSGMDGGSAWLYRSAESQLPPPLLQCGPSMFSDMKSENGVIFSSESQPPSKRNRKGKPHKLIENCGDADNAMANHPQNLPPIVSGEPMGEESHDMAFGTESLHVVESSDSEHSSNEPTTENGGEISINQPYFPSFQKHAMEVPVSPLSSNGYSPSHGPKRPTAPCEICGRSFPTKEKMADHMRSHSKIKQFSCLVCGSFFKYRRGVTNHLKEVHHMSDRAEINSKVGSDKIGCSATNDSPCKDQLSQQKPDTYDTNISQQVIEDTLSSLAEIKTAMDSATMPALSSDDSVQEDNSIPFEDLSRERGPIIPTPIFPQNTAYRNAAIPGTGSSVAQIMYNPMISANFSTGPPS